MKRTILAALLFGLPILALALDFEEGAKRYEDYSEFSQSEKAAISVLTDIGAVAGNPDGTYAADRRLNRAEFSKIALLSFPENIPELDDPVIREEGYVSVFDCFPDVRERDWFSGYICPMKAAGAIEGNPDGLFHPEREVNYAEAVKILVELAGYTLPEPPENERWAWYRAYLLAAQEHGVAFPGSVDPAHFLTRGQMARLAAAFVAEASGELEAFRAAEKGQSESSESSSSSSSQSSSSVSSSVSSSSSSASSVALYPARDSFLLMGKRTPLILGGDITSAEETAELRIARVTLRSEITSIDKMYLVDASGNQIAELTPVTFDNTDDRKWEALTQESTFTFPLNTPVKIGIVFDMKSIANGGSSNQLVEIESFSIQAEGIGTGNTRYLLLPNQVYPMHQTAFGKLTRATSALPTSGTLQVGSQKLIGSYLFNASASTGGTVYMKGAEFLLSTADVNVSNIKIGDAASGELADCGTEILGATHIVCSAMHEGHSYVHPVEGLVVNLYADVALSGSQNGQIVVTLEDRGEIGDSGSFTWGDGSGQFNWLEADTTFGGNVTWTVTP